MLIGRMIEQADQKFRRPRISIISDVGAFKAIRPIFFISPTRRQYVADAVSGHVLSAIRDL